MEPGTPAAAESTPLVLIEQPRIRIPRRSVERFDLVLAHRLHPTKRRKIQTTRRSPEPVLRMTPEAATGPLVKKAFRAALDRCPCRDSWSSGGARWLRR